MGSASRPELLSYRAQFVVHLEAGNGRRAGGSQLVHDLAEPPALESLKQCVPVLAIHGGANPIPDLVAGIRDIG